MNVCTRVGGICTPSTSTNGVTAVSEVLRIEGGQGSRVPAPPELPEGQEGPTVSSYTRKSTSKRLTNQGATARTQERHRRKEEGYGEACLQLRGVSALVRNCSLPVPGP